MILESVWVDTGKVPAKDVRERGTPELVMELCVQCWGPYLAGHLDQHLLAIPHRRPPMEPDAATGG